MTESRSSMPGWGQGPIRVPQTNGDTWDAPSIREIAVMQGAHALVRVPYDPARTASQIAALVVDGIIEAFEACGITVRASDESTVQST